MTLVKASVKLEAFAERRLVFVSRSGPTRCMRPRRTRIPSRRNPDGQD